MREADLLQSAAKEILKIIVEGDAKVEVFGVDVLAYEAGTWRLSVTPAESTSPLSHAGSYVFALKKQVDGSWKIAVDIGNGSQPSVTP